MILLAALALQTAMAPVADADADVDAIDAEAVVAAFKEVCWSGVDVENAADGVLKHGWVPVEPGSQSVADAQRKGMEGEAKPYYRVKVRQFQRKVQDRDLLLTFQRGELSVPAAESFGSTHCLIRELGDPLPFDILTVQKAMGRSPSEITQGKDGSLFLSWHGLGAPTSVTIAYIPPKSDFVAPDFSPGIYLETEAYGPYRAKPNQ